VETVNSIDQKILRETFSRSYAPPNMVLTAAGKIDHDNLVEALRKYFHPDVSSNTILSPGLPALKANPTVVLRTKKELEQAHICIGMMGYSARHPDRYAAGVMNVILGGSMSSRLFQKLREERGLCYSIYSSLNSFQDCGYMSVYAGTSSENVRTAVDLILQECRKLVTEPVGEEELENAKNHLKGSLILSLESSSTRMFNLARNDLYYERQITAEEVLDEISGVSIDDVQKVAMELFQHSDYGIVVVGDIQQLDLNIDQFQTH
jgi:predicted Zn-dependent peptidase